MWGMVKEAINSFKITLPLEIVDNEEIKKLKQFCVGRPIFSFMPSLYRVLTLTYPRDSVSLSLDGSINNEMAHGSMGEATGILSLIMFCLSQIPNPNQTDNDSCY